MRPCKLATALTIAKVLVPSAPHACGATCCSQTLWCFADIYTADDTSLCHVLQYMDMLSHKVR